LILCAAISATQNHSGARRARCASFLPFLLYHARREIDQRDDGHQHDRKFMATLWRRDIQHIAQREKYTGPDLLLQLD
jgi:hypothetical protein